MSASIAAMAGVELAKAILIVLISELIKAGMTADQIDSLYLNTKIEFLTNKPENLPEA